MNWAEGNLLVTTVTLSRGAMRMAAKQVVVKRLAAIHDLGAMDVLCTDKTGTLTMDRVILERHCDVSLKESEEVLALAYMNSHFQTGLRNLLDRAILDTLCRRFAGAAVGLTTLAQSVGEEPSTIEGCTYDSASASPAESPSSVVAAQGYPRASPSEFSTCPG
jgi:magnesium-transporting ATPase (P-type)